MVGIPRANTKAGCSLATALCFWPWSKANRQPDSAPACAPHQPTQALLSACNIKHAVVRGWKQQDGLAAQAICTRKAVKGTTHKAHKASTSTTAHTHSHTHTQARDKATEKFLRKQARRRERLVLGLQGADKGGADFDGDLNLGALCCGERM
jgi:hypothetical protein